MSCFSYPQVDLFFYREPEEAKQQEEEEAVVAADYGIPEYSAGGVAGLAAEQWPITQIGDSSWSAADVPAAIPAVTGVSWTAEGD